MDLYTPTVLAAKNGQKDWAGVNFDLENIIVLMCEVPPEKIW